MTEHDKYNSPKTGIHKFVAKYIRNSPGLSGKNVLDIPCGAGRASYELKKRGANVIALDLFPEFMKPGDISAEYADLSERLPIESNSIDYILCQEGIEHIPNQLNALKEFNRVLKNEGILLITTPNYSHIRARLSHFLFETKNWRRLPPTAYDSVWFTESNTDKLYFGHLFLLGVQHLQILLTVTGFKVNRRMKTEVGTTSLILGLGMYPLLVFFTLLSLAFYRRKSLKTKRAKHQGLFWDRIKLNLSPKTLFCKHIFWELQKKDTLEEVIFKLKKIQGK